MQWKPLHIPCFALCSTANTREEQRRIRCYTRLKDNHPHPPLQSPEADEHLQSGLRLSEDLNSLWKHLPFAADLANAPNFGATVRCQYFGGYWHNSVIISPRQKGSDSSVNCSDRFARQYFLNCTDISISTKTSPETNFPVPSYITYNGRH